LRPVDAAPAMAKPIVLIVEDNPTTRKLVRITLESGGYEVVEAGDGRTALEQVSGRAPALVLQDLVLPDMDGMELVRRIRALPEGGSIPVLAYSGLRSQFENARKQGSGFTDFLLKPVDPSRLLDNIAAHLRPRATAAAPPRTGRRVLLVQDDPVQLTLETRLLREAGFMVQTAPNGVAALEMATRSRPEAILSDVMMPGMDGFQLSLAVRQDPALSGVPVVLASASYTEAADRALAHAAGASALVSLTADGQAMIEALRSALEGAPPPPAEPVEAKEEYTERIAHQVERQASINAVLRRRLAVLESELAILSTLTESAGAGADLNTVMESLLYRCLDAAGISKGAAYLIEPGGGARLRVQLGWRDHDQEQLETLFGRGDLLRQAIDTGQFIQIAPSGQPGGRDGDAEFLARAGVEGMAIAPLGTDKGRFGLLVMASPSAGITDDWSLFTKAVGAQIGQALQLAQSLAELRESKERLGRIIETLAEGLITFDPEGKLTSANAEAAKILGLPRQALLDCAHRHLAAGASALDGGPLEIEDLPFEQVRRTGGTVRGVEFAQSRPDGSRVILSVNATPLRDEHQRFCGTVSLITDITERKRADDRLREDASRQKAIAELGQHGLAGLDLGALMQNAVDLLARMLGMDLAAVMESPEGASELVLRAGHGWDASLLDRPVIGADSAWLAGWNLLTREPAYIEDIDEEKRFSLSPLLLNQGARSGISVIVPNQARPYGVLCAYSKRKRSFDLKEIHFVQSIAHVLGAAIERKKSESELARQAEELARYNSELEQFAYVAAHDLQEPLRTVASFTQLLEQRYRGRFDADADKFIGMIVSGAARMRQLIDDLLSYSRVAFREAATQLTDSSEILSQSLFALGAAIEENGAMVTSGQLPKVLANAPRLDQVFRNLIGNALKFRGTEPPRVHIAAEPKGSEWLFSVRDNGIGIEPQYLDRIFRIFERLHSRQSYPGTGIGLAVCKRVVERLGGRIWVESAHGAGSTFYFTLPRIEAETDPKTPATADAEQMQIESSAD